MIPYMATGPRAAKAQYAFCESALDIGGMRLRCNAQTKSLKTQDSRGTNLVISTGNNGLEWSICFKFDLFLCIHVLSKERAEERGSYHKQEKNKQLGIRLFRVGS